MAPQLKKNVSLEVGGKQEQMGVWEECGNGSIERLEMPRSEIIGGPDQFKIKMSKSRSSPSGPST